MRKEEIDLRAALRPSPPRTLPDMLADWVAIDFSARLHERRKELMQVGLGVGGGASMWVLVGERTRGRAVDVRVMLRPTPCAGPSARAAPEQQERYGVGRAQAK